NTAIAQIHQTSQVVHDLRLRTGASITAAVCASSGSSNIDKELVAQAEVRQASPVCLAQLVERVETRPQALRAQPRGHPPISQPGDPLQRRVGGATDQDGRMRTLYRPRTGDDGIKLIVLALKRHLAPLAQTFDNLDTLVRDPTTCGKGPCPQGDKLLCQP